MNVFKLQLYSISGLQEQHEQNERNEEDAVYTEYTFFGEKTYLDFKQVKLKSGPVLTSTQKLFIFPNTGSFGKPHSTYLLIPNQKLNKHNTSKTIHAYN